MPSGEAAPVFLPGAPLPFVKKYSELIKGTFPDIKICMGTHQPADRNRFLRGVKELLCQTLSPPQTMSDMIRGTMKIPEE
jgi:hypothetical protein